MPSSAPLDLIKTANADSVTPLSLARALRAKVVLESASYQKGRARYSLLMVDEAFTATQVGNEVFERAPGGEAQRVAGADDILQRALYYANQHRALHQDFPFPAGGVGYCSFEYARFCDTIDMPDKPDALGLPDAAFIFGHSFVVFDHYTDQLYLIALNYREWAVDLEQVISRLEQRIYGAELNYPPERADQYRVQEIAVGGLDGGGGDGANDADGGDSGADAYCRMVDALRADIRDGNLLQAVPSRRRQFRSDMPAIVAYRRLRQSNPSPYMFYLDFTEYQIFGTSPEVHTRVRERHALIRPIAGTRRRGATDSEDAALETELLADAKERAEHLMLVDLGRNDLGRVCVPGTVQVTENMVVERYSKVMHIVSQVEGELRDGVDGVAVLRATFPAGTVSGAPKIRAIETVHRLEPFGRRFYAGVIGYIEPDGDLDTCIAIRTALCKDGVLTLQAGGGIVYDSVPERELEETNEKMAALLRAIGIP